MRALQGTVVTPPRYRLRSEAVVVGSLTAAAGVALFAVAWSIGSVGWMLADVPGAANNMLRQAVPALFGAGFLAVARVGIGLRRPGTRGWPGVVAVLVSATALLLAMIGAGRFAGHSAAAVLRPVLVDATSLNTEGGSNGVVIMAVALGLAAASVLVLRVGHPRP